MCAGLLPVVGVGPCHVTVTPTPPTSGSGPAASAQYLPAGNHPPTAAPVQSVSQHTKVKYASFVYELSGLHGSCFSNDGSSFDFTTMQWALFVPGFQNNQLPSSFGWLIWSRWMQRLRQVTSICCIGRSEEIWPITTTVGASVDGACPKPWELRIPRTDFSGPQQMGLCENSTKFGMWMAA